MQQTKFSVVIPTRGDKDMAVLQAALDAQTLSIHEVIVVPDPEGRGPSWARNRGLEKATGDIIGFLDDDCIPPPEWAKSMADAIHQYKADGAGGNYLEQNDFLRERRSRVSRIPKETKADAGHVGQGGNMIFTKAWLDKLKVLDGHVFDEDFIISQDWELTWRTRLRGGKLVFVPAHVAHHKTIATLSYLKLQFGRGLGTLMLFLAQKSAGNAVTIHHSLLWGEDGIKRKPAWLKTFWLKAVGPFPQGHFSKPSYFFRFWLGEKFEGFGFVYYFLVHKLTGRYAVRDYSALVSAETPG